MKKFIALVGICLLSIGALADTKPTDKSLAELLVVTDSQKLMDSMWPQLDGMIKNSSQQALAGTSINEKQKKILDESQTKMAAVFKEELSFEKMKPMMISVYKETFSQDEVDSMLEFYKSKGGQAVIKKMPQVMQSTMTNMQAQMSAIIPKLQKIQQDAIENVKANADAPVKTVPEKTK